ncbi:type VII secretion-associated protein [Rhodococcoides kyotonense]|uniref:Type VII secretion-associated protein, Rv3446c family, C-terminal domain-containing protein n=1 Tax=Rhodococcoides kyotonense TaxID=398843 RepID=A0A239MPQ1_9NOCA|nr:type VII secretion-associated protein [Rhodococcus kyotonensis]SNT44470.1 type VII secretion-associated protein, Rv3446c family, C-terminal domain-containing protein [Rhodococcus kyotonensis]
MRRDRTYAAVHLGDGVMSVLSARGEDVVEIRHSTAAVMRDGTLSFPSGSDVGEAHVVHLSRTIDDVDTIIGSTVVSTIDVLAGTLAAALAAAGAAGDLEVLELACPASWGRHRRRVLRTAAQPHAREVLMVDTAVAAVHSVGERAPEFGVVVEMSRLESVVSTVRIDRDGRATTAGAWAAVGTADGTASTSIEDRVTAATATRPGRDAVRVFVVDAGEADLLVGSSHVIHRLDGVDIVRAMAGRAGIAHGGVVLDEVVAEHVSDPPLPVRSAAWLAEATTENDDTARRSGAVPAALGGVAVVALVGLVVFFMRDAPAFTSSVASVTSVAAKPVTTVGRAPPTAVPSTVSTTEVSASPSAPVVETNSVAQGRARVEVLSTWTAREEPDRLVLVPPDLPDRRIVVTTIELTPGATFDDVADDLFAEAASRGDASSIEDLTRATDVGGRVALSYVESPDEESVVVWRIFVEDDLQIAVGCQSKKGEEELLVAHCERVAATLTVEPT